MLRKEPLLEIQITALKKRIAVQIQKRFFMARSDFDSVDILGWTLSQNISWKTNSGIAILCQDGDNFFWHAGYRTSTGQIVIANKVVHTQIFII